MNSKFEVFAWLFMRVSGLVLLFLALGHLVIMHIINNISNINYAFVVERWGTPFWRCYDGLMLFLALLHGINGLRTILEDYLRPGLLRVAVLSGLYLFALIFLILGFVILFTFQPK